jgi:hypothetical protein
VKQRLKLLRLGEAPVHGMLPLTPVSSPHIPRLKKQYTHPLHNAEHGDLVLDVEAQKYRVPRNVRQPLHRVQVRRARGVLELDARGEGVIRALIDIRFVAAPWDCTSLQPFISSVRSVRIRQSTYIGEVAIASTAIYS